MTDAGNGFKGFKTAEADDARRGEALARHEAAFGLATHAENVRFAVESAQDMALLAVEYGNRHGDTELLEEYGYAKALHRLLTYIQRDMQALEDDAYRIAREL